MGTHQLWSYVVAVVIVMAVIVVVIHFIRPELTRSVLQHCLSFLLGMLAMYIAVHLYSWR